MSKRPSDGMTLDELRDEFDWMFEFQSRMAERICGDADVHSLVDYVGKLESENAKLRKCCVYYDRDNNTCGYHDPISHRLGAENAKLRDENARLRSCISDDAENARMIMAENAKLREQVASFIELSQDMVIYAGKNMKRHFAKRLRKLGVPL